MTNAEKFGTFVGRIGGYFLTGAFLYWGWNVVAPHLNAPPVHLLGNDGNSYGYRLSGKNVCPH